MAKRGDRRGARGALLALLGIGCAAEPLSAFERGVEVSLAGAWRSGSAVVEVPIEQPGGYIDVQRRVVLPPGWREGDPAALRLSATGWYVTVSVDGAALPAQRGGPWPVEVDLSAALSPGEHTLRIQVQPANPQSLGEWTWGYRRVERATLGSAPVLALGAASLGEPHASLQGDTLRASVDAPPGSTVQMRVVRDGAVIAELPAASADDAGRAAAEIAWAGPRWGQGSAPYLQYLVAELPDGRARAVRFGARSLSADGWGRLLRDGAPTYVAAQRFDPLDWRDVRSQVARSAAWIGAMGANAIEIHASRLPDEAWDAAAELGIGIVGVSRCVGAGRPPPQNQRSEALLADFHDGYRRLSADWRRRPALLLWTAEGSEDMHPDAPAQPDAPYVGPRQSRLLDEAYAFSGHPRPGFLVELPWASGVVEGRALHERLGRLLADHARGGIGAVLPSLSEGDRAIIGANEYASGIRSALASAGVAGWDPSVARRGPAEVRVYRPAAQEGEILLLELAHQPDAGAAVDARGVARFIVDYVGPAVVKAPDGSSAAVDLRAGVYAQGTWQPAVAAVLMGGTAPQQQQPGWRPPR